MPRLLATLRQWVETEMQEDEDEVVDDPARVKRRARRAASLAGLASEARARDGAARHYQGVLARARRRWLWKIAEKLEQQAPPLGLLQRCHPRTACWPLPTERRTMERPRPAHRAEEPRETTTWS